VPKVTHDILTKRRWVKSDWVYGSVLLTDSMISQVQGNIVASSGRPDNNNLLSNVLPGGRELEGVYDFPLKSFLQATIGEPAYVGSRETRRKNLFGVFGNIQRPASESQRRDDMGWPEDSFGLGPVGEYSGHIDDPRSRWILFSECNG